MFEIRFKKELGYYIANKLNHTVRCAGVKYYKDISEMYFNLKEYKIMEEDYEYKPLTEYEVIGTFDTLSDIKIKYPEHLI